MSSASQPLQQWRARTDALFDWWRAVGVIAQPDEYGLGPDFPASVLFEGLAFPAAMASPHREKRLRRMWAQVDGWFTQLPQSVWLRDRGTSSIDLEAALREWLIADIHESLAGLGAAGNKPVDVRPWVRALPSASDGLNWEQAKHLLLAQVAPSWPVLEKPPDSEESAGSFVPAPPLVLDSAHLAVLRHGLDRVDMDIRWMWRLDGDTLRLWRSWTGRLFFKARLAPHGPAALHVERLWVVDGTGWPPARAARLFSDAVLGGVRFAAEGAPVSFGSTPGPS